MKKWIPLALLCSFVFCLQSYAQDVNEDFALNKVLPNFNKSSQSIIEHTAAVENHSTLFSVLQVTHLDQVLDYDGEFTVFAPSNLAFQKLSKITVDKLLDPVNRKALTSILSYHIVAGKLSASSILRAISRGKGTARFTTVQGEKITAKMRGLDIVLIDKNGNEAIIVTADSNQSNGVIHEIDTVFLPAKLL